MKFFNQKQLSITLLGFLVAPILFFSFVQATGGDFFAIPGVSPSLILHLYTVVVTSFMAGIQWGIHFCKRTDDSVYLISFFIVVLAWLSLRWPGSISGLGLLLVVIIISMIEEWRLSQQRVTTLWHWQTRCACSGITILSLLLALSDLAVAR
jgi:Protein of unknown function (DUF3429)